MSLNIPFGPQSLISRSRDQSPTQAVNSPVFQPFRPAFAGSSAHPFVGDPFLARHAPVLEPSVAQPPVTVMMVSEVNELSEKEQLLPDKETVDITFSVPLDSGNTPPTRRRSPRNHASKPVTWRRTIRVHRTNAEAKHDGGSLISEEEAPEQSDRAGSTQCSSKRENAVASCSYGLSQRQREKRRKTDDINDSEDYTDNCVVTSMTTSTAASSPKLPNQIAPGDESCRALHPWTVQEIHYLRQIVGASSGYILWSEIAQEFTDRTAFECSLRWSQIRAEDKRIRRNNKAAGAATLRSISKQINSETEQDTEKNDSPSTKEVVIKTGRWSRSEDKALHSGVEEHLRTYGLEALPPVHLPSDADLKKTDQSTQPAGEIRSTGSGWCSQSSHSRSAGQSSDEGRYSHDGTTMAIDDGSELFDEIVDTSYVENNDDDDGNGGACGMNVETGADAIVTGDSVYRHMHQKSIINPDEDHPSEYHGSRSVTQDPHLAQSYRWHKHRQGDSKSYVIERLEAMTVSPRRSELRYQPEQWCRDGEERAVNGMSNIHESVQETAMQQQQSFQRSQEYYLQRQGGTTWNTAAPHPAIYPGSPLLPLQHSMPTLSPIDGATLTSTLPRGYGQATGSMDPGACSQPPSCQAPQPCGDGWNASTLGTDGYCFNVWEISSHHQELEYGNMAQTWNDTNGSNTNAHDMDSRDESGSGSSSSDDASTNAMIYNLQFAISQLQQSRELKTRQCHQEPIQLHQKQEQESRGQPSDPFLVAQPHNPSALSSSSSSSFSSMIALSPEWLKSTLVSPGLNEHRSAIPMTSASSTESSTTSHSPSSSPQTNTHTAVQSAMGTGGIDGKDFGAAVPRRVENTSEEITGPQSNAYDSSHDNHANAPPTTAELNFNKNLNTREEYTLAISRAMATCPWNLITHSSIPGRTGVQAQARWSEALDPQVKKGKWSPDEDALLLKGVQQSQKCWIWIADGIPGRTQRQCRTRWVQISARYEREAAVAAAHSAGNGQPLQALAK